MKMSITFLCDINKLQLIYIVLLIEKKSGMGFRMFKNVEDAVEFLFTIPDEEQATALFC